MLHLRRSLPEVMSPRTAANISRADRFGAVASLLCAIHCAALPLATALLPSLGVAAWLGEGFGDGVLLLAPLLGLLTLAPGYRRHRGVPAARPMGPRQGILG